MNLLNKIKQMFFSSGSRKNEPEFVFDISNLIKFKVVVIEFSDNVESRSGEIIAKKLQQQEGLEVSYFEDPFYNLSKFIDEIEPVSVLYDKKSLNEGKIKIGNFDLEIIYTPGHSLDGISILWKNNLFTGDFLFYNTVGRVDLPTSNLKDLTNSLTKIIPYLKDGVIIYPGHGKECKKQTLVKINPYIIATIGDKNV